MYLCTKQRCNCACICVCACVLGSSKLQITWIICGNIMWNNSTLLCRVESSRCSQNISLCLIPGSEFYWAIVIHKHTHTRTAAIRETARRGWKKWLMLLAEQRPCLANWWHKCARAPFAATVFTPFLCCSPCGPLFLGLLWGSSCACVSEKKITKGKPKPIQAG